MKPEKTQMAQTDGLDQAIDQVAARLTHVDDSPEFAMRIVASLPERITWFGWLSHSWVPRLAMLAAVVIGGVLWMRREPVVKDAPVLVASAPAVAARIEPVVPVEPVRIKPDEPVEPVAPEVLVQLAKADHEYSLPPVAAPKEIGVEALAPADLPSESLGIAPLAIADLPLSAEFPQRHEE